MLSRRKPVRRLRGPGQVAGELDGREAAGVGVEREGPRRVVPALLLHDRDVDARAPQPRRGAGLEAADLEAEVAQLARQLRGGLLARAPRPRAPLADVDDAVEEGAGGEHDRPRPQGEAPRQLDAGDAHAGAAGAPLQEQPLDPPLAQVQARLPLEEALHREPVGLAVVLHPRAAHGVPARGVEGLGVDARRVRQPAHRAAERVDLAHELPLAEAADRGVAGHEGHGVEAQVQEERLAAHAGGGERGLAAGVAGADDDEVERTLGGGQGAGFPLRAELILPRASPPGSCRCAPPSVLAPLRAAGGPPLRATPSAPDDSNAGLRTALHQSAISLTSSQVRIVPSAHDRAHRPADFLGSREELLRFQDVSAQRVRRAGRQAAHRRRLHLPEPRRHEGDGRLHLLRRARLAPAPGRAAAARHGAAAGRGGAVPRPRLRGSSSPTSRPSRTPTPPSRASRRSGTRRSPSRRTSSGSRSGRGRTACRTRSSTPSPRAAPRARVFLELGLQSAHPATLARVNRLHAWEESVDAVERAAARGLAVVAHLILGLPGETPAMMRATARAVAALPVAAVKIHSLLVARGDAARGRVAPRRGAAARPAGVRRLGCGCPRTASRPRRDPAACRGRRPRSSSSPRRGRRTSSRSSGPSSAELERRGTRQGDRAAT